MAEKVEKVSMAELINRVKERTEFKKNDVKLILDAFDKEVQNALLEGKNVTLLGLGVLDLRERAERKGRNPQTGEEIIIPSSTSVGLKVGKLLKTKLNEK